ncbi:MAG: FG-GAP repeat protein, partial [Deltaproteobacteria bacterium]|nr:FG-GAP repeat protein [Deltaproteobacteria bacterium]
MKRSGRFMYETPSCGCRSAVVLTAALSLVAATPANASESALADEGSAVEAQDQIAIGEYAIHFDEAVPRAVNRQQQLEVLFEEAGATIQPQSESAAAAFRMRLAAWGSMASMTMVWDELPRVGVCADLEAVDALSDCSLRVEYARLGITEWWVNTPSGLEHGFTVDDPTAAAESLVMEVELEAVLSKLEPSGEAIALTTPDGKELRYAGIVARDAAGLDLPARFELSPIGVRIVVDTTGARWPVVVDPLVTTATWSVTGDKMMGYLGRSVASAGDVNGDGYGDVIVGAPYYNGGLADEGRVFLYLGSASGQQTTAVWSVEGNQAGANLGASVASAGDVNGDGYGDVVIGAPGFDDDQSNEGRAFVYLGAAGGLAAEPAWTKDGNQASVRFGSSVASAGDVNGDGYADVVVGAPWYPDVQPYAGRAYVYLGSASGLSSTAAWVQTSGRNLAYFGTSVASAGDVNGDGYSDVIVGASADSNGESYEGRAFVYLGSGAGLQTTVAWSADGNLPSGSFGSSVAAAGDVNGDGYGDVVIGAPTQAYGEYSEGRVYVFLGSASGPVSPAGWVKEGDLEYAYLGWSVSSAGDVNGDGYGDVVVGSMYYSGGQSNEGRALVYLGSGGGLQSTPIWSAESEQSGANLGYSVASAGDVNGDGLGDVIVGAPMYTATQTWGGKALIYLGATAGLTNATSWSVEAVQAPARLGTSVASAGDLNGDGYADVVVGAPYVTDGQPYAGQVFAYYGASTGLAMEPGHTIGIARSNAYLGLALGSAGDVNGDGYSDVIAGAPSDSYPESYEGRALVYFGSATGLQTATPWSADGNEAFGAFGGAVASAGDVNGDGYGDVIVGAPSQTTSADNGGRAFVYLGSSSGLASSPGWVAEGDQLYESLGWSVASAGDVNGDGYGDVVVGAIYYSNNEGQEGGVLLYLGSELGLELAPATILEADQAGAYFGYAVASAGDVNGDGYGDVIVGARSFTGSQSSAGRAFVYLGSAGGLAVAPVWVKDGVQAFEGFGASVGSAGDFNGDGYGDLIVGASSYSDGDANEGRAYVYRGTEGGVESSPAWSVEGNQSSASLGAAVASAGDADGDGLGDIVVGAPGYDGGRGKALLFRGNSGDGVATALGGGARARQPGAATPIAALCRSTASDSFDVAVMARSPRGRSRVKLQIEAKPRGTPFSGTGLQTAAAWTDIGLTGATLQRTVTGLTGNTDYHWRARLLYDSAQGATQLWSRWLPGGISGSAAGTHVRTLCAPSCEGKCGGGDGCGGTCTGTCQSPETCGGGGTPNVCGCTLSCTGKCGGADGCGGTCADTCVSPETCGGGGTSNVCGCTLSCTGKCGGADGCGGTCADTCVSPETCGGGGTADVCGCTPTTCASAGESCGGVPDRCGGTLACGTCAPPQTCGGGGTPNVCGCTLSCAGKCGGADGCGGTCADTCVSPETCGGGGTANVCGCTPACAGKCGGTDGCGGTCPNNCSSPETCGGGGQTNVCGCTPEADPVFCGRLGKNCDDVTAADTCGTSRTVSCGTCSVGQTCGGGGTSNVCGCAPEADPAFCTRLGKNCGSVSANDNCGAGRTADCGACTDGLSCNAGPQVNVCGYRPVASAGPDQTVPFASTVGLDGTASSDADGETVTYLWTMTSRPLGSAALLDDPTAAQPTFVGDVSGDYLVEFVVNDGHGPSDVDTVSIIVDVERVAVPDIQGLPQTTAASNLIAARLVLGTTSTGYSTTLAVGEVLSQSPAPGTMAPVDSTVDVVIVVNRPPVFDAPPAQSVDSASCLAVQLVASDPDTDPLTIELVSPPAPPAGMTVTSPGGLVTWYPTASDVGGHTVTVRVTDDEGESVTRDLVVAVTPAVDMMAPLVELFAPATVAVSSVISVVAQVSDDTAVTSVAFLVDGLPFVEKSAPPYEISYNAPAAPGQLSFQVTASDAAGHSTTRTKSVSVATGPDVTAPVVTRVIAPPTAAPGDAVYVAAEAADDWGVTSVEYRYGTGVLGSATLPPHVATLTIPTGATIGQPLALNAVARDAAGNQTSAPFSIAIAELGD